MAGGGGLSCTGVMIGSDNQRPVPRFSYCASRALPNVAENNNMAI